MEAQSATSVPELVPLRYARMLESPFRFFRGAASIMAADLAPTPRTEMRAQLCGDARRDATNNSLASGTWVQVYRRGMAKIQVGATGAGAEWVPQACTLPTTEQPLRVAEFDAFFADAVTGVVAVAAGRVRLDLRADPEVAGRAAQLAVAETGCCSFFTFALTATGGTLSLEVTVPDQHIEVLDALAARAVAALGGAG